jgi:hypothetical protein
MANIWLIKTSCVVIRNRTDKADFSNNISCRPIEYLVVQWHYFST